MCCAGFAADQSTRKFKSMLLSDAVCHVRCWPQSRQGVILLELVADVLCNARFRAMRCIAKLARGKDVFAGCFLSSRVATHAPEARFPATRSGKLAGRVASIPSLHFAPNCSHLLRCCHRRLSRNLQRRDRQVLAQLLATSEATPVSQSQQLAREELCHTGCLVHRKQLVLR